MSAETHGAPADETKAGRRQFLAALPLLPFAGLAEAAQAAAPAASDRDRMIALIESLECAQPWIRAGTYAAQAFAAWQLRRILGLDLPDPHWAEAHVEFEREALERYNATFMGFRDREAGIVHAPHPMQAALL